MTPMTRPQLELGNHLSEAIIGILERIETLTTPGAIGRVCHRCGGLRPDTQTPCDVCHAIRNVHERAEFIAEVEWIIGTDTPQSIAHRLGYRNVESLERRLHRAGRADLARQLRLPELREAS